VFTNAQESERDLAGASITTVIMVGNAFGSALGGMVTNIAGVAVAPSAAAAWLFGLVSIAPLCAMVAMRRVR
jgi:predicted MFS family arabinose efflux permease